MFHKSLGSNVNRNISRPEKNTNLSTKLPEGSLGEVTAVSKAEFQKWRVKLIFLFPEYLISV